MEVKTSSVLTGDKNGAGVSDVEELIIVFVFCVEVSNGFVKMCYGVSLNKKVDRAFELCGDSIAKKGDQGPYSHVIRHEELPLL